MGNIEAVAHNISQHLLYEAPQDEALQLQKEVLWNSVLLTISLPLIYLPLPNNVIYVTA